MAPKNKHGLKRTIPPEVKRAIRQECGFGCVVCGAAIVQYDHVDPEFHDAKIHDPTCMALLCGSCHDKKTRGLLSVDSVKAARARPFCITNDVAGTFALDVSGDSFSVTIHGLEFINVPNTIRLNGCNILSIKAPDGGKGPPLVSAKFFDADGRKIGGIEENEWTGSWDVLDINWQGSSLEVRSNDNHLDLKLTLLPPSGLKIERMNLYYGGSRVIVDQNGLRTVNDSGTSLSVQSTVIDKIEGVSVGVDVRPEAIGLGTGKNLSIQGPVKSSQLGVVGKGSMKIRPARPDEIGNPFPPGTLVTDVTFLDDQGRPATTSIGGITISVVDDD